MIKPRILSVRQPWAWLIVNGFKDIENRVWHQEYRGKVWIHASLTFEVQAYETLDIETEGTCINLPLPNEFDFGGIVGSADIVDCVSFDRSKWFEGPYGFVLQNQQVIEFKPMPGALKFFKVPEYYCPWCMADSTYTYNNVCEKCSNGHS